MKTPSAPAASADEIDLNVLFFKLRRRWPVFVVSLLLAAAGAYLYLQVTPPVYTYRATMLLGDQATGSKRAQDLLQMLEVQQKGLKMEDELGLITSAGTVQQAVRRLPYAVEYHQEPATWLNGFRPLVVRQQPATAMPFAVAPALATPQLTNVRVYVEPAGPGRFRLHADAKRGQLVDLRTGYLMRELTDVHLDETVKAGDTLRHHLLRLVIRPNHTVPFGQTGERHSFLLRDLPTAAGLYASGLAVRPLAHDSRILELRLKSTVPAHAVMFLDTLMAGYVAANLREKNNTGRKTLAFIDEEIAKLGHARRQAADKLSEFRSSQGVVDVGAQSTAGIQRLNALQTARAQAATRQRYCQDMLAYLRANRDATQMASPSSAGIDDGVLSSLILQLGELNGRRAALKVSGSDNNPLIQVVDESIRSTKQALIETLTNMSRTASIGLRDLDAQLGQIQGQISRMPENERQFSLLKGQNDFNEKKYTFLVERRSEAALALATNATDKHIVDRAQAAGSGPDAPNPKLVGLVALLAGLLLPAGAVVLLDKTNRSIQGQEDLAELTDIPVLGIVAHGSRADTQDLLHKSKGPLAECFRSIRVNLQYLDKGPKKKVLGVTSSMPGEGKSFCAANLAMELASTGHRVILVETDLRRPTQAGYFKIPSDGPHGLASFLSGRSSLAEACRPSEVPGLDLLLCGTPPTTPTHLLESSRLTELLQDLRTEYDYVVLDTPPMVLVAEYFVLMRYLDATVYVVRHNHTDRSLVSRVNELYEAGKIREVYIIINDVRLTRSYEYRHQQNAYGYYR
ncbi:polysaccharide biosynthesis tyrosine autokinase [Hymenobacter sp. BT683]|uniref:non-specific protein-tyrosine kinase n=1 Tax=Hymenobacter jeongseonensis TaxID=2791027 RepID=A0ABS0ID34_9BACT|nr:polysaccharide biosynthesis tyrosine autokinase [Hymenobacter jeongseonensis]MBF9236261.1 polysaccharide biosynthesis tyrosine autokinase [Hymenobacter jeongseonensis]